VNSLRLWIAILGLACFGAGTGFGFQLSLRMHPRQLEGGPFEDYQREFSAKFQLSPERSRLLGQLLTNYAAEIESLKQARLARSMSGMEGDLQSLGREYHDLIRNYVLPPGQRPDFDQLAAWSPVN
jgi:hypothetical protein